MILVKHAENTAGRDFFVGDIHGQYDLLMEAMLAAGFDKSRDRLFSVGDLIDRGARSLDCLSLPFEPWFHGVRGNHEMLAHDALIGEDRGDWMRFELWQSNGGTWAMTENLREVRQILGEALRYLPWAREVEVDGKRIGLVHAEPPDDWARIEEARKEDLTWVWGRHRISTAWDEPVANIDAVVVGHTIVRQPSTLGNVHYIDTGAFCTGCLTLIDAREVLS